MKKITNNIFGLTLIETLMIISIILLILIIEGPNIKNYSNNWILKSATQDLASDLRYTQQLTVTEQRIYNVSIDTVNKKYSVILEPSTTIKTVYLPSSTSFGAINGFTDNKVTFNFMGAVSQSGSITISNQQGTSKIIYIRPSGYIEIN
jgi:Tfp pilus assembly protein FimT